MRDLRERGRGYRESGAFLLASRKADDNEVCTWLPYDELAPESLAYDYIRLETEAFGRLWDWCTERNLKVVADVHTHPTGPRQSESDRAHPMLALAGHVALIVPWFAQRRPRPCDVSFNLYKGGGKWSSYFKRNAAKRIIAP
jgi:proteasome lid subunit RPN8/RPN11